MYKTSNDEAIAVSAVLQGYIYFTLMTTQLLGYFSDTIYKTPWRLKYTIPNATVEWMARLLFNIEVLVSNFGPRNEDSRVSSIPWGKCWYSVLNQAKQYILYTNTKDIITRGTVDWYYANTDAYKTHIIYMSVLILAKFTIFYLFICSYYM
jgi:hypothetical protein